MRRQVLSLVVVLFVSGLVAPATGYAQQAVNFYVGGFVPRGEDARTDNDVLVGNLADAGLAFKIGDFNGVTFGGEWLFGLGEHLDAGVGLGIYSQSVPSVYRNLTHSDGSEIEQDLKLRVVPFTATVRFLPLGRVAAIQPYIGAGVGVHCVALQRDRGVRGLHRLQHFPRQLLRQRRHSRAGGDGRRRHPDRFIVRRLRNPLSVGPGRIAGRSGLCRDEDRSRRVQLPGDVQGAILKPDCFVL